MSQNYVDPINRGPVSAAGVAAGEGAKGAARGFLGGLIRGPVYGFLVGAATVAIVAAIPTALVGLGALALGASVAGFATTAAWVVGVPAVIGGAVGMLGGTIAGGPLGALFGGLRGMGRGRDIVNHERGAAQMLETQQAIAQSQMATAQALQSQASRPVIIQPASAPVVAPGFTVTSPAYQGQGVNLASQTVANDVGGMSHAQRVDASRAQTPAETARA